MSSYEDATNLIYIASLLLIALSVFLFFRKAKNNVLEYDKVEEEEKLVDTFNPPSSYSEFPLEVTVELKLKPDKQPAFISTSKKLLLSPRDYVLGDYPKDSFLEASGYKNTISFFLKEIETLDYKTLTTIEQEGIATSSMSSSILTSRKSFELLSPNLKGVETDITDVKINQTKLSDGYLFMITLVSSSLSNLETLSLYCRTSSKEEAEN